MSERRKTKEKQLNEVGSRTGGVGGNASGLANRVGSAVMRWGHKLTWRGGEVTAAVTWCSSRPKPSSSLSTGVLCVATAWYPGVGAFAWWSDGGELEAKDGGGGYGMMCGEAAAVTWLCKRKLVHAVATDVHFKKKKKLIWLVVTRLVTIVVAVGIVGDEMHEVAPLENSPPSGAPGHQAVATRKTPVDDDELGRPTALRYTTLPLQLPRRLATHHVTAAATLPPRHIPPTHATPTAPRHHHAGKPLTSNVTPTPPPAATTQPQHGATPTGHSPGHRSQGPLTRPQHGAQDTASNSNDDGAGTVAGWQGTYCTYLIMQ
ncbi:hypothetical protein EDB89DRAFT_1911962 [Lactarius sanguifluus]|nr:hypothetical protein EDB89DRAFT_1911962 [Lactarius sanguifluus]